MATNGIAFQLYSSRHEVNQQCRIFFSLIPDKSEKNINFQPCCLYCILVSVSFCIMTNSIIYTYQYFSFEIREQLFFILMTLDYFRFQHHHLRLCPKIQKEKLNNPPVQPPKLRRIELSCGRNSLITAVYN